MASCFNWTKTANHQVRNILPSVYFDKIIIIKLFSIAPPKKNKALLVPPDRNQAKSKLELNLV